MLICLVGVEEQVVVCTLTVHSRATDISISSSELEAMNLVS